MSTIASDFPDNAVCVVGLGYVGLTLAVVLAGVGFQVDGVEIREDVVAQLRQGRAHFFEPGLNNRLKRLISSGQMRVTQRIPADTKATVYFVSVGTPLGPAGQVHADMITASCTEIAQHMKAGDMVIMRSTVCLGTTRAVVIPILDKVGVPYDIAFCPERTVEGQALAELRTLPQIIGAGSGGALVRATRLFNALTPTVVRVPSIEVAEMVKLVDNTYRDITFAFANEVAHMCDGVGVSAHDVIMAGKLGYPRTNVPMPGLVGGPCLEKDTHILAESVRACGVVPEIAVAARTLNERQPSDIVRRLKSFAAASIQDWPECPEIAVLGFAFKGRPVTDDLRGSMVRPLLNELRRCFPRARLRGWDAAVTADAISAAFKVDAKSDMASAVAGANLVLIANNHPYFQEILLDEMAEELGRPALIYDLWNHFSARDLKLPAGVFYMALGDGQLPVLPALFSVPYISAQRKAAC